MRVPRLFAHALLLACSVGGPAATAAEATPMPAEIAPRAEQSLLTAITRAGAQRLVAVGARGHILLSDDDGAHWRQVASPVNSLLTQVAFLDAQTGWPSATMRPYSRPRMAARPGPSATSMRPVRPCST